MRVPFRTDTPYCPKCGNAGPCWPRVDGERCPIEPVFAGTMKAPGDARTSPEQATPVPTGDDEMNDSPQREVP